MAITVESLSILKKQHSKPKQYTTGSSMFCFRLAQNIAAKNGNGLVSWAEMMQQLTGTEVKQIQLAQKVRYLIHNGQFIPAIDDSCCNIFLLYRNITEFERRQKRLQESWLAANEMGVLAVAHEESKEFRPLSKTPAFEKLMRKLNR